ncbi:MAG: class I SAM-dependent methyltransferase [Pseudopedobacter saltans]|uniref:Class I SAM-dependent methyltransferase n=1 Tax=Pseudopedobacter saltans TaxID=151895 RepID=A0A2W5GUV7_9SPHI|nr:MAG: class I SAM-dependent methyltransferase [Pseudopedobacter saltans]
MSQQVHYSQCPVCNSRNIQKVLTAEDFTVSHEKFEIWECADCTARFTQDVPDMEGIGVYYKAEAYISHTDTNKGLVNRLYHYVRSITMKQKKTFVEKETGLKGGSVLDIGAGTGAFASVMKTAGWQVTGLEPDEIARTNAERLHGLKLRPSSALFSLEENSFDAVTMWHVMEHVHDLHGYWKRIARILKDEGVFIVAVPNYTSYDAQAYGSFWAAWDVPRHLYHFSPKSMDVLARQYGFQVTQHIPMIFDSYYVSMLSEKYKSGKSRNLAAFATGLESNQRAARNPKKYSSVIYIMKKTKPQA